MKKRNLTNMGIGLSISVSAAAVVAAAWVVFLSVRACPDTHFVSLDGSDEYPYLTPETAGRSIRAAVDAAEPGDTVEVLAGEYLEQVRLKERLCLRGGGTGYVEWGPTEDYGRLLWGRYVHSVGSIRVYEFQLPGLEADTLYHYRVRHGSSYSPDSTFRTATSSGDSFRFLAYGDNRGPQGSTSFQQNHFKLLNSALANTWEGARPRFVLHAADFVYTGATAAEWHPHFFDPAAGLLGSMPLWPCIGNHEYNGDDSASNYRKVFCVPSAAEYWYSFDYGGCHFTVLDTKNTAWFQENSQQWNWLKSDLEGSSATWKFVLLHCPPYTHSNAHRYGSDGDQTDVYHVRKQLAEKLFNKSQYGVDAVFGGHNHFYEHSFTLYEGSGTQGVHYIVSGGGGACGDHDPRWDWEHQWNPQRHCADPSPPLNYLHYLTVDVPGGSAKPVVKHWRHQDGQPPLLVETVTVGEPPQGP